MKKLFFIFAALLTVAVSFAQEEEDDFRTTLSIIPRMDAVPSFNVDGGQNSYNWGNSGLYVEFSHKFSESLSFSTLGLLVNEDPKSLYANSFRSDASNWLAYCTLNYTFGNFEVVLGKDYMKTGGYCFEYNDYDNCFENFNPFVSEFPSSGWGAQFYWNSNSEKTRLGVQVTTSPFGERPFASGKYAFFGVWYGNYGPLSLKWSAGAVQNAEGRFQCLASLGQKLTFGDFWVFFDWTNTSYPTSSYAELGHGHTFHLEVFKTLASWADFTLGAWMVKSKDFAEIPYDVYGRFDFFPIKDSRNLRLHLSAGWSGLDRNVYVGAGATYFLNFNWK